MRRAAACCALCWAAAATAASDGPLQLSTDGTFSGLFLEVTGADARSLVQPELDVRWSVANDWSVPTVLVRGNQKVELQSDEQADALGISVRTPWSRLFGSGPLVGDRGLWERFSSAVEGRIIQHWGGWTDGLVEGWHHLIGSFNFERELYPRNAVNVTLRDLRTGRGLELHASRFAIGDLVLRTQFLIAEGGASSVTPSRTRWGVSARFDAKAPLGSPAALGGSGGWDVGLALLGTVELTSWLTAHALVATAAFSPLSIPTPLQPKTWHQTAELSLAARVGSFTLLAEDRFTTPLFEGGWKLVFPTDPTGVLSSGYYGAFRSQNQLSGGVRYGPFTFWFSEDWTPGTNPSGAAHWFYNSNTPDIAFGLAFTLPL